MQICRTAKEKAFHHEEHDESKGNLQSCRPRSTEWSVNQRPFSDTPLPAFVFFVLFVVNPAARLKLESHFSPRRSRRAQRKSAELQASIDLEWSVNQRPLPDTPLPAFVFFVLFVVNPAARLKRESHFSPPSTRRAQGRLCGCNDRLQLKPNNLDSATIQQMPLFQPSHTLCSLW